jgi:hypothetical protein
MVTPLGHAARFFRPVLDSDRSQTLFLGNVGPTLGNSIPDVTAECLRFGSHHVDLPDANKTFLFVTFGSQDAADAAKLHFQRQRLFGRDLTVKYAKLSPKYKHRLEVCSHASYVMMLLLNDSFL